MRSYTAATFVAAFGLASAQLDASSLSDADFNAISKCAEPCVTSALGSLGCDLDDYTCLCTKIDAMMQKYTDCLTGNNCVASNVDVTSVLNTSRDELDQACSQLNSLSISSPVATSVGDNSSFNGTATATGSAGSAATSSSSSGSGSSSSGKSGSSSGSGSTSGSVEVTTSAGSELGVHFSLSAMTVGLAAVLAINLLA